MNESNRINLDLEWGRVVIECLPDVAPQHVARIKELSAAGFYDNSSFHRVNEIVAQGGDTDGSGKGSGVSLKAEFSDQTYERGMVAMARGEDPDSADSEFFIIKDMTPEWQERLSKGYTIWGRVVEGMKHVDRIKQGSKEIEVDYGGEKLTVTGLFEEDETPDRIVRMRPAEAEPGI